MSTYSEERLPIFLSINTVYFLPHADLQRRYKEYCMSENFVLEEWEAYFLSLLHEYKLGGKYSLLKLRTSLPSLASGHRHQKLKGVVLHPEDKSRVKKEKGLILSQFLQHIYSEQCMMDEVPDYDDCDLLPFRAYGPFKPQLVGIGPGYVHTELGSYEGKQRYVSAFLRRPKEIPVGYVREMERLVVKTLHCYKDNESFSEETRWFEHTLCEDSCFVVELFRKYMMKELRDTDDPIFNTGQTLHLLRRDLISFGNQLPFFVLVKFFNMTKMEDKRDNLIDLALHFFQNMVGHTLKAPDQITICGIKHLLGLVHDCLCLPIHPSDKEVNTRNMEMEIEIECEFKNFATELQEAGIKFEKFKGKSLLDIKFRNGVMRIPALKVADNTMYLLQNLIEYEKQFPISRPRYVTDYAKFLLCLINTPKDVELLRRSGIIENWIGNDEVIYSTLNKLGSETIMSSNFSYSDVLKRANEHCKHRRNIWMANLRRNYFNSPWAFVSFLAAVVLLLLTLTQTVFSVLSYHP